MNICFVLPGIGREMNGGYKIVYQYANFLSKDGFNVYILYKNDQLLRKYKLPKWLRKYYFDFLIKVEPRWFKLNKNIKKVSSYSKNIKDLFRNNNVVIATSADTVSFVKNNFTNSKKIYFIQGYEKWAMPLKELHNTYKEGFINVVISKSLKRIVDKHSAIPSVYIRNAIDNNKYKVKIPIKNRNKYVIGMLYNPNPEKGFKYAYEAVKSVKKMFPQLKVIAFGVPKRPSYFPEWITYYSSASMRETIKIYNSISIFISSSVNEGFGLTGLEAMACGAALVASNYEGVKEYAVNEQNALISPVKDTKGLEKDIIRLLNDDSLRIKLALNGSKVAKNYSWINSYKKFKEVILKSTI